MSTTMVAISGVAPAQEAEVNVMTVFPSLAASPIGEALGRIYALEWGIPIGAFRLSIGKLAVLAFIPVSLLLYALGIAPFVSRRYSLTNRRVLVQRGWMSVPERWIGFERFDAVDVVQSPGQVWFRAADLIFRKGKVETFRLAAVPHADAFRSTILKARNGYVGIDDTVSV